jgi:hypothetical protein
MKLTKKVLKRIIREEYKRVIQERLSPERVRMNVYEMGLRPDGIDLDSIDRMYGPPGFDAIDAMMEDNQGILDEEEGVFYSDQSPGMKPFLARRGL